MTDPELAELLERSKHIEEQSRRANAQAVLLSKRVRQLHHLSDQVTAQLQPASQPNPRVADRPK